MKKKRMLLILVLCLTIGSAGSGVYAYLTDEKETINEIRLTQNDTHIEEEFDPPQDPEPGMKIVKKPGVVNDSRIPVYVRVLVRFSDSAAKEQLEPVVIHSSWKEGKDGYYYYQKKLASGERTEPIFENIVIKSTVKKEELLPFDVLVYQESVQAEGFVSPEEAFETL